MGDEARWYGGVRARAGAQRFLDRLRAWSRRPEARWFVVVMGVALVLRIGLAPWYQLYGDQKCYIFWGQALPHHFFDLYSYTAQNPDFRSETQYPPFAMYIFGIFVGIYHLLVPIFNVPPVTYSKASPLLITVMKMPAFLADMGIGTVIYIVARKRLDAPWPHVAAAGYLFAPAVLLDSAIWGQTDAVILLLTVLALIAVWKGRGISVGVFLCLAITFKPQPAVLLPLILIYLWRWAGWRQAARTVMSLAATGLVICWPYLLPPHPEMLLYSQRAAVTVVGSSLASLSAFNLWFFVGIPRHDYVAPFLGPLTPNVIGSVLFLGLMLLALIGIWRDRSPGQLFLGAGLVSIAIFCVATLQLDRYLFPAAPLLLIAAIYGKRTWLLAVVYSITNFANMVEMLLRFNVLNVHQFFSPSTHIRAWLLQHYAFVSWTSASINLALLVWIAVTYLQTTHALSLRAPAMWLSRLRGRVTVPVRSDARHPQDSRITCL